MGSAIQGIIVTVSIIHLYCASFKCDRYVFNLSHSVHSVFTPNKSQLSILLIYPHFPGILIASNGVDLHRVDCVNYDFVNL